MKKNCFNSPHLARWLLKKMTVAENRDILVGDFEELFGEISRKNGKSYAKLWYRFQVLISIPAFLKSSLTWSLIMFKNYLKIAMRNMLAHKAYSFINIFGLALGMACTIIIFLWVKDELNFDKFHSKKDTIYRVVIEDLKDSTRFATTPGPLAEAMKNEIPGVINSARIFKRHRLVMRYEEKAFYESRFFRADLSLFDIFSFEFLKGDPDKRSDGIIITEKIARKYFGNKNPLGKALNLDNEFDIEVVGVIKDIPETSHMHFDFIMSIRSLEKYWPGVNQWKNFIHETYVLLEQDVSVKEVGQKITQLIRNNCPKYVDPERKIAHLQPLTSIHLDADIRGGSAILGNSKYVFIFSFVAVFILLIACINFINLSTARSLNRSKEVGMRKTVGAGRAQLIRQFYIESMLLITLAFVLSLLLVNTFLPQFNHLSGKNITMRYLNSIEYIVPLVIIVILTGILAGSYPAIYLSAFKPIKVLEGNTSRCTKTSSLRNILVVFQFSLSIMLMIGTGIIYKQLHFIKNRNLGFYKDNIVYIPAKGNAAKQYLTIKRELLKNSNIQGVTIKSSLPMNPIQHSFMDWEGRTGSTMNLRHVFEVTGVDHDFIDTLKMEIVDGRNFSKTHSTDANEAFIINEEAVKRMGLLKAVGNKVAIGNQQGSIIGVVKNVNFKSLHFKVDPIIFRIINNYSAYELNLFGIIMIRVKGDNIPAAITAIKNIWNRHNPSYPFEFHFLDETYNKLYFSESRVGNLLNSLTLLAILISCLGLFGLAAFTADQKTKEIGVRKIHGASTFKIVQLLNRQFLQWVILANIIAWPVAYLIMNKWLQNFAYKTSMEIWVFLLSGLLALFIAFLTVCYQSLKAATANPVDSLKYE
jgi:ABC-type antimicrobial peptide transport system permease subunit